MKNQKMFKDSVKCGLGLLFCFGLSSCKSRSYNSSEKSTQSPPGFSRFDIVASRNRTYWFEPTDIEMESYLKSVIAASFADSKKSKTAVASAPLPPSHPLVKRFQGWSDTMDGALRKTPWGMKTMAHVPRPHIYVWAGDVVNAFNLGGTASYPASVTVGDTSLPTAEKRESISYLDFTEGGGFGALAALFGGASFQAAPGIAGEVVDRWNPAFSKLTPGCVGNAAAKSVTFTGCQNVTNPTTAQALSTGVTLNAIVLFSRILDEMTEAEAVAVLAHEMGHYYRAHSTDTRSEDLNYYYDDSSDTNPIGTPRRPLDAAEFKKWGSIAKDVSSFTAQAGALPGEIYASQALADIARRQIPIETFSDLRDDIKSKLGAAAKDHDAHKIDDSEFQKRIAEAYTPVPATDYFLQKCNLQPGLDCTSLKTTMQAPAFLSALEKSFSTWQANESAAFLAWQKALSLVAPSLPTTISSATLWKGPVVDWDVLLNADRPDHAIFDLVRTFFNMSTGASITRTLHEALLDLRPAEDKAAQELSDNLAKLADAKVGWYTIEQEADEVSLELLALAGLRPEGALDMQLALLRVIEKLSGGPRKGEIGSTECKALLDNNFKNVKRSRIYVTPGGWSDIHHSSCYRVFNVFRTLHTEKFILNSSSGAFLTPAQYSTIRSGVTHSAKIIAPPAAPAPGAPTGSAIGAAAGSQVVTGQEGDATLIRIMHHGFAHRAVSAHR